jgi:hypothetical protein
MYCFGANTILYARKLVEKTDYFQVPHAPLDDKAPPTLNHVFFNHYFYWESVMKYKNYIFSLNYATGFIFLWASPQNICVFWCLNVVRRVGPGGNFCKLLGSCN